MEIMNMKKTIKFVHKLDELNRLVIPKGIRVNLNIRANDFVEMWNEENIIKMEKYYILQDYEFHAKLLAESISEVLDYHIYIVDRESVLAYAGKYNEVIIGKKITKDLINMLDQKATHIIQANIDRSIPIVENKFVKYLFLSQIITPIILDNMVIGGVIFEAEKYDMPITELEKKFMQFVILMLEKIVV
jgi:stage V sporulation protein T